MYVGRYALYATLTLDTLFFLVDLQARVVHVLSVVSCSVIMTFLNSGMIYNSCCLNNITFFNNLNSILLHLFFTARCPIFSRVWKIAGSDAAANRREHQTRAHETWKASSWLYSFPSFHVCSLGSCLWLTLRTASQIKLNQSRADRYLISMPHKGLRSHVYR